MQAFVERHGLEHVPQAVDEDGSLWAQYGVGYQPAWIFINQDGDVRRHAGALSGDDLQAELQALVDS